MKLIVGLGNPKSRYADTRHNTGAMVVDAFAAQHSASWKEKTKFHGHVAELTLDGHKVILLQPTTYYNLSGQAVRAVSDFYKIAPADILLVHDELMLPSGTIRTRYGGGDAGNNGVKSVSEHVGQGTARLRIGIGSNRGETGDADFVLAHLTRREQQQLAVALPQLLTIITSFVHGEFDTTTHRMAPPSTAT